MNAELLNAVCEGVIVAVTIRWFLHLNVELPVVACIGVASRLLAWWLDLDQLLAQAMAANSMGNVLINTVVAMPLLAIAQLIRGSC